MLVGLVRTKWYGNYFNYKKRQNAALVQHSDWIRWTEGVFVSKRFMSWIEVFCLGAVCFSLRLTNGHTHNNSWAFILHEFTDKYRSEYAFRATKEIHLLVSWLHLHMTRVEDCLSVPFIVDQKQRSKNRMRKKKRSNTLTCDSQNSIYELKNEIR